MLHAISALFGRAREIPPAPQRPRPRLATRPQYVYAIGDVHGCLDELERLEASIVDDAAGLVGEKYIVLLGDYIDRGPRSADVLDHLLAPPPSGFHRVALLGNHEQMLLDFLDRPSKNRVWLEFGGVATLASYGVDVAGAARRTPAELAAALSANLPRSHLAFLRELPDLLSMPGLVFVHAGLRAGRSLAEQTTEDLIWLRNPPGPDPEGVIVVHGHTPNVEPMMTAQRICVDTAAFATGRLTSVRIDAYGQAVFHATNGGPQGRGHLPEPDLECT